MAATTSKEKLAQQFVLMQLYPTMVIWISIYLMEKWIC